MDVTACSFCHSEKLDEILKFGDVALAGAFLKKSQIQYEKKYPLTLLFCNSCNAVQVKERIDPSTLFNNYFYFSSAIDTLNNHFSEYALEIKEIINTDSQILEIGCNDGVLLKPLYKVGFKNLFGIDPAQNVISKINIPVTLINDFFSYQVSNKIKEEYGPFKLILANNVFAHINNINDLTEGIYNLLDDDGIFIFEVHYLHSLLDNFQFDFIYHEHIYYYSILALKNHFNKNKMEIFDIKKIKTHSGSVRVYVSKKNNVKFKIKPEVSKIINEELSLKYNSSDTFINYFKDIIFYCKKLNKKLISLKKSNKVIYGYGASGRANTILQLSNIDNKLLDCIIDDNPEKHNYLTPGTHIPIKSRHFIKTNKPDYILVLAWSFYKEIKMRNIDYFNSGGMFIIPFPNLYIDKL
jgi:methylation protein EvaC